MGLNGWTGMDKHEGCCGLEDRRGNNSEMVETIRLLNSWVQSVLVLPQLKPPNPSLFEYGEKDFIHPSPLGIPPIQNYPCNQSMPAHRLIINLSTLRNPYSQSNVNFSSIHTFPEQLQSIYLARPSVPIAEGGWMGWSALNKWRSACSWLGWTVLTGTGH